jgi:hypothetical protein
MHRVCAHCASVGQERLGYCHECSGPVCEKCGNIQHIAGETRVYHDLCLKDSQDSGFSMIKFVR